MHFRTPIEMKPLAHCTLATLTFAAYLWSTSAQDYEVVAHTQAGAVCGGYDPSGQYAYFLGVPYGEQPIGVLRFQELQDPKPWEGCLNTTTEGPICPQKDLFYGSLMNPQGQSEACIHANVYVPRRHLPAAGGARLLPVLVYVHGGSFDFGSGDRDLHGPEYLVQEDVVVVTFNYRLGVFGFLSLNSSSIPGNAGLRDMVKLLEWVQANIKAFGGDPDNVTLAGQSAGATAVHLLTLSTQTQGLFNRAILMSGTATRGYLTASPAYAQLVSDMLFNYLGINGSDPEEAHRKLVALPLETIMDAHNRIQNAMGLLTFTPVVESVHPGVKRILDDDPEALQAIGRGKDIPFIIGFTNAESEVVRHVFEELDMLTRINNQPELTIPPALAYSSSPESYPSIIAKLQNEYFNGSVDMKKYLRLVSDSYFIYPALNLAATRAAAGGAPVFLYRFAYNATYSVYKMARTPNLEYLGATHSEDLAYIFRANHALTNRTLSEADFNMTTQMITYFTNFMRYSKPTVDDSWPPVQKDSIVTTQYNNIINFPEAGERGVYQQMTELFDSIYDARS